MIHTVFVVLSLGIASVASAAGPVPVVVPGRATVSVPSTPAPAQEEGAAAVPAPANASPAPTSGPALPAMIFFSSLAEDELFDVFKAEPGYAALDKELYGSPLKLIVTHTSRPTAGGQAAGVLSAVLSGSTLGLLPIVTNERFVVRYEVMLNGKTVASCSFERTSTRAINIWAAGDADAGLGKDGMAWLKSTAREAAGKLASDPALAALQQEIRFYFPDAAPARAPEAPAAAVAKPAS
jgi:hypothetical protein